jgi:ATP synthase protein I
MQETSEEERLRRLADRLAELKRAQDPAPPAPEHHTQAQLAWRMVTELVAGLLVGFAIGYGLDALFGTRPWLLVLFTLLGFAAGVQTMMRTAREVQAPPGGLARGGAAPGAGQGHRPASAADDGNRPATGAGHANRPASGAGEGQEEDARRG